MGIFDSNDLSPSSVGEENITVSAPGFDLEASRYMAEMNDFDITEEQKRELLETLWAIMRAMVDLGFDIGTTDLCGQLFADFNEASDREPDGVESAASVQETASGKGCQ